MMEIRFQNIFGHGCIFLKFWAPEFWGQMIKSTKMQDYEVKLRTMCHIYDIDIIVSEKPSDKV